MAKLTKKVLGYSRGKVADIVVRKYRKDTIVSGYQPDPRDPKTEDQLLQRTRFGRIARLAARFNPALLLGYAEATAGSNMAPRNAFMKDNFEAVQSAAPGSATINFADLVVAKGSFYNVQFGSVQTSNPLEIALSWVPNDDLPGTDAQDAVQFLVYCPDMDEALMGTPRNRSSASAIIEVPSYWNGMKVHVWGFVQAKDNAKHVSLSAYIGQGTIS